MRVEIDAHSGFCFGVVRAITLAEQALQAGPVFSLGDIVHNRMEIQRLEELGMKTATHEQIADLTGKRLFVRAHGEPPDTFEQAASHGVEVLDATCPVVAKLQRRVVEAHAQMHERGGQVVILGKRGHAEVVGLAGQVAEPTIIVENADDLSQIDFSRPVFFLSQTTQSVGLFEALTSEMRRRGADVTALDTICRQVSGREQHLKEFAARFDAVVFVCGRKSSNGRVLYDICRASNPRAYCVEEAAELRPEWFDGMDSVGVCGATSTPEWLMKQVAQKIEKL